jgi:ribosome biogenesis GTPase
MSSYSLAQLGWRACFAQQLTIDDLTGSFPARICGVHRSGLTALSELGEAHLIVPSRLQTATPTVGDWVLVERATPRVERLLERQSLLSRLAAGQEQREQAIAANIDTLFVVTSCNDDFNPSRLERYLAVALDAHIEPVVVLTKADLCDRPDDYLERARAIAGRAQVVSVDATSTVACSALAHWLSSGQTVAFVGSSGVGKSTLVNTLQGQQTRSTAAIREHDSKGRHTTTARSMLELPGGAWVIDTPGIRELKIGAVDEGISAAFREIEHLARRCRFRDCNHEGDRGCALQAAVADGSLEARRLRSYLKLQREAANAARTLHERRERERQFGRLCRDAQRERRRLRKEMK